MRNIIARYRGRAGLLLTLSLLACRPDQATAPDAAASAESSASETSTSGGGTSGSGTSETSAPPTEGGTCPACAFGPKVYVRSTGQPVTDVATFAGNPAGAYIIEIDDFGTQGANATVVLNGQALDARSGFFRQAVSLQTANELRTRLTGKPGSKLQVSIFQEVHSVTVTPNLALTRMPATQQFTAVAKDANGVVIPGQTFEWQSSAASIATIGANSGVGTTTGAVHSTTKWRYLTISTGEGTTQIIARAIGSSVQGSVPWKISAGFVYSTFRAPLPLNSPNRHLRATPEAIRYDQARLNTMAARCQTEKGNEKWFEYALGGERLFFQCFPALERTNLRVRTILGVDIYDLVPNVGAYGRYCGDGHPDGPWYHDFANTGNYQPKDPIDGICMEHDAQDTNHELSTSDAIESLLATCIVRYGVESETLFEDGVRIARGSARWDAFWNAWPQMAETRAHFYTISLASCPDGDVVVGGVRIIGVYNKFLMDKGLSVP